MPDTSWYYMLGDIPAGPVSWTRLVELAQSGLIKPQDLVRHEESFDWIPFAEASAVRRIDELSPSPPVEKTVDVPSAPNGWSSTEISVLRRYGARMLDTSINGIIGVMAISFAWFALAPISAGRFFALFDGPLGSFADIVVSTIIAGFVNGIVIGATGSSIGKAVFGIKVVSQHNEPIGIFAGWLREAKVWLIGMGLGIPFISLLTMYMSARRLKEQKETIWDRGLHVVLYRSASNTQTLLNIFGVVLIFAVIAFTRSVGQE